MLDFLGVTEHFSCMENTPFSFPALFRDMAGEAVSLDGVIFSGSIVSANQEMVEISIEKGESSNEVIFSFPALPEGRWSYNVLVQADDGSQRILFSGYISVLGVSRVAQLAGGPPMKNRTLLVAMPGEATMRLRMEWMATTAAQAFAYHALQASKNAHADAEMASQAAKTATDAAATAAARAEEAEGYAGSAWASKRAAADSATAAGTSATNAARDAKSANDAKTAVESLAATWPETVSDGKQQIIEARNEAVTAIQDTERVLFGRKLPSVTEPRSRSTTGWSIITGPAVNEELYKRIGKYAAEKYRELGKELTAINGASRNPKVARKYGVNVNDAAAVQQVVERLQEERSRWKNFAVHPDLLKETNDAVMVELGVKTQAQVDQENGVLPLEAPEQEADSDDAGMLLLSQDVNRMLEDFIKREEVHFSLAGENEALLAPNGEPSHLTPQQYRQVRTPEFKRWFGDWEKVARFKAAVEKIMSMDPVAAISGQEFQKDGIPLTEKVTKFWKERFNGVAISPELGEVRLDLEGVKSSIGHGIGSLKSAAFACVEDVIRNGVVFDRQKNWKERGYDTAVIAAPVTIKGVEYVCEVVVEQRTNRQGFYLHEVEIKKKLEDVFKTSTEGGTPQASRSILALRAEDVKREEEGMSKVVDENGEPLVVYHGSPHVFTVFDVERSGENFNRSREDGGLLFFSSLPETAEDVLHDLEGRFPGTGLESARLYACFMRLRRPFTLDLGDASQRPFSGEGVPESVKGSPMAWYLFPHELRRGFDEGNAHGAGYDGIVLKGRNAYDGSPEVWGMATDSRQVKSAADNRGTFDSENPDITFSIIGEKAESFMEYHNNGLSYTDPADGKRKAIIDSRGVRLRKEHVSVSEGGHVNVSLAAALDFPELFRAYPSEENVCLSWLWQALETGPVPTRFYLSANACRGILRRAERRGKKLPEMLEAALRARIGMGDGSTPPCSPTSQESA